MTQRPYALICSPPGVGLRLAKQKLEKTIGDIEIRDVEDALCESREASDALARIGVHNSGTNTTRILDITWFLGRSEVYELWQSAVSNALFHLGKSQKKSAALTCHLIYHCGRREEFYSPIKAGLFGASGLRPSHVLLLIDDVYDMYVRLTQPGELFDPKYWVPLYLEQVSEDQGLELKDLPEEDLVFICLQWQVGVVSHILQWRHLEIVTAQKLARELDAKFLVWATKQSSAAIASWIQQDRPVTVYLSHPISRPRREYRKVGRWHTVVHQFNELQRDLLAYGIISIMPSAIDEFRMRKEKSVSNLSWRRPLLEDRWPLPESEQDVLYSSPGSTNLNQTEVLAFKKWDVEGGRFVNPKSSLVGLAKNTDALLTVLERQIEWQVASRDHLFVSSADGILVFRPLFGEGIWSSGVQAELLHWQLVALTDTSKRVAFVHFTEDIDALSHVYEADENKKREREQQIATILEKKISSEHRLEVHIVKNILSQIEKGSGMLDRGAVTPSTRQAIVEKMSLYSSEAEKDWLRQRLSGWDLGLDSVRENQVRVWRLENHEELRKTYGEIASFLGGSPQSRSSSASRT